jgi:hypothetical protein
MSDCRGKECDGEEDRSPLIWGIDEQTAWNYKASICLWGDFME